MPWIRWVTIAACGLAMLAFTAGILLAGHYTLWADGAPAVDRLPSIVSYFVGAANTTLAANLGAVLGIAVTAQQGVLTTSDRLQFVAAIWYVVSLLVAAALWGAAGFTDDATKVVALLPELARNGAGVLLAILAATLGINARTSARIVAGLESNPRSGGRQ